MPIEEELEEMNKVFTLGNVEEKVEEEPIEEEEVIEDVEPEPEPEPGPQGDLEPDPTPAPEPDPEPEEEDELTRLRRENVELKAKQFEKPTEPEPEPTAEPDIDFEDQDFLGDIDPDDLIRDPKEFNAFMNKIYQKAVTDTRKVLGEGVLRSIPDIVKTNLTAMVSLQKASDEFYENNEDLKPFKKAVASVFEEISSADPSKSYVEVLEQVGEETRKRLGLQENVTKGGDDDLKIPKLKKPGKKTGRIESKPKVDPLLDELEAMNKVILGR